MVRLASAHFLPQNLVSLLLRPLRFCLPSESMRRLRIRLLKILHAPHVTIISAYESISPSLIRQFQMATSAGYQDTMKITQPPRLIGSPRRRLNTQFSLAGPYQRVSRTKPRTNDATAHTRNSHERSLMQLHSKIDHLSQKIDQLIASQPDTADTD